MNLLVIILLLVVVLPVSVYLSVKFGWAGYFRAKQREREKDENKL